MYNNKIIIISYVIFLIVIYITILKGLLKRDIKYQLLKILPITLIFDIPISYLYSTSKTGVELRVWNFYIIIMVLLYFRECVRFIIRYKKYLLVFYFYMIIQLLLNSFDIAMLRGYVKFIFSYLPLVMISKIYLDKMKKEEILKILNISGLILGAIGIIQIISFKMNIDLFIIDMFQKPSGVFSEPIWLGVYMLFLILILDNRYKKQKIFFFIMLVLSGSKAAILMLILVFLFTMKGFLKKLGVFILGLLGIGIGFYLNLYSVKNLVASFFIHSFNWIIPLYVYLKLNILNLIFGVGPGNINSMAHNITLDQVRQIFHISKNINLTDTFCTLSSLGGDVANIWIEALTSFGILGLILWIYIFIKMYLNSKNNKISKRLLLAWTFIGTIHPLYYMAFGIFMIMLWKPLKENKL